MPLGIHQFDTVLVASDRPFVAVISSVMSVVDFYKLFALLDNSVKVYTGSMCFYYWRLGLLKAINYPFVITIRYIKPPPVPMEQL